MLTVHGLLTLSSPCNPARASSFATEGREGLPPSNCPHREEGNYRFGTAKLEKALPLVTKYFKAPCTNVVMGSWSQHS